MRGRDALHDRGSVAEVPFVDDRRARGRAGCIELDRCSQRAACRVGGDHRQDLSRRAAIRPGTGSPARLLRDADRERLRRLSASLIIDGQRRGERTGLGILVRHHWALLGRTLAEVPDQQHHVAIRIGGHDFKGHVQRGRPTRRHDAYALDHRTSVRINVEQKVVVANRAARIGHGQRDLIRPAHRVRVRHRAARSHVGIPGGRIPEVPHEVRLRQRVPVRIRRAGAVEEHGHRPVRTAFNRPGHFRTVQVAELGHDVGYRGEVRHGDRRDIRIDTAAAVANVKPDRERPRRGKRVIDLIGARIERRDRAAVVEVPPVRQRLVARIRRTEGIESNRERRDARTGQRRSRTLGHVHHRGRLRHGTPIENLELLAVRRQPGGQEREPIAHPEDLGAGRDRERNLAPVACIGRTGCRAGLLARRGSDDRPDFTARHGVVDTHDRPGLDLRHRQIHARDRELAVALVAVRRPHPRPRELLTRIGPGPRGEPGVQEIHAVGQARDVEAERVSNEATGFGGRIARVQRHAVIPGVVPIDEDFDARSAEQVERFVLRNVVRADHLAARRIEEPKRRHLTRRPQERHPRPFVRAGHRIGEGYDVEHIHAAFGPAEPPAARVRIRVELGDVPTTRERIARIRHARVAVLILPRLEFLKPVRLHDLVGEVALDALLVGNRLGVGRASGGINEKGIVNIGVHDQHAGLQAVRVPGQLRAEALIRDIPEPEPFTGEYRVFNVEKRVVAVELGGRQEHGLRHVGQEHRGQVNRVDPPRKGFEDRRRMDQPAAGHDVPRAHRRIDRCDAVQEHVVIVEVRKALPGVEVFVRGKGGQRVNRGGAGLTDGRALDARIQSGHEIREEERHVSITGWNRHVQLEHRSRSPHQLLGTGVERENGQARNQRAQWRPAAALRKLRHDRRERRAFVRREGPHPRIDHHVGPVETHRGDAIEAVIPFHAGLNLDQTSDIRRPELARHAGHESSGHLDRREITQVDGAEAGILRRSLVDEHIPVDIRVQRLDDVLHQPLAVERIELVRPVVAVGPLDVHDVVLGSGFAGFPLVDQTVEIPVTKPREARSGVERMHGGRESRLGQADRVIAPGEHLDGELVSGVMAAIAVNTDGLRACGPDESIRRKRRLGTGQALTEHRPEHPRWERRR